MFDSAATIKGRFATCLRRKASKENVNLPTIPVLEAPQPIYPEYPEEGFSHPAMGRLVSKAEVGTNVLPYVWKERRYAITVHLFVGSFQNNNFGLWVEIEDSVEGSPEYKKFLDLCFDEDQDSITHVYGVHNGKPFCTDPRMNGPQRPYPDYKLPTQLILTSIPVVGSAYKGTMYSPSGEASFKKTRMITQVEQLLEGVYKLTSEENETFLCLVTKDSPHACEESAD